MPVVPPTHRSRRDADPMRGFPAQSPPIGTEETADSKAPEVIDFASVSPELTELLVGIRVHLALSGERR
jgi:hypothetical protein